MNRQTESERTHLIDMVGFLTVVRGGVDVVDADDCENYSPTQ